MKRSVHLYAGELSTCVEKLVRMRQAGRVKYPPPRRVVPTRYALSSRVAVAPFAGSRNSHAVMVVGSLLPRPNWGKVHRTWTTSSARTRDVRVLESVMQFSIDDVDLASVAQRLKRVFSNAPPQGYVLGRSAFRDAVVEQLGCSELEAENLVDTLVNLGYLRFKGSPEQVDNLEPWVISTNEE